MTLTKDQTTAKCERPGCTSTVVINPEHAYVPRFCSRPCARQVGNAQRAERKREEWEASERSLCPCGNGRIPYEVRHSTKYCSTECRTLHGKKKQRDPEKWITFVCLNKSCGKTVTRYKSHGNYHKYCSNECARRHTRTKQHIVVDDAVVLDSPWEALFWGLCAFRKLPIERFDRERGVEWRSDCWYAPDFWLPSLELAVEVKGSPDGDDPTRWQKFSGSLTVLGREELEMLCKADNLAAVLCGIATITKP